MKRQIIVGVLFVAVAGCISSDSAPEMGGTRANYGKSFGPPSIPGVQGPYGQAVPMHDPYNRVPPANLYQARAMMSESRPLTSSEQNMMAMSGNGYSPFTPVMTGMEVPRTMAGGRMPSGLPMMGGMQGGPPMMGGMPGAPPMMGGMPGGPPMMGGVPGLPGGMGGLPTSPGIPMTGLPPVPGGLMPATGRSMPGSGVVNANIPPGGNPMSGAMQAQLASSAPVGSMFPAQRTQVFISRPANMKVFWFTQGPDGKPNYSQSPLETPGRYNFAQGAIYRLKLTHIPGRPALELFPTLEVVPTNAKTSEFLAHNAVPLEFSEDDFKQVVDRNYIVKVVYLPDPQYQGDSGSGPDEIVSTRLEPGTDPIQEALRRGSILLVIRIGNIDQGLQHSPPMSAAAPGGLPPNMSAPPGGFPPGGTYTPPPKLGYPPNYQVPYNVNPVVPPGGGHHGHPKTDVPNRLPPLPGYPGDNSPPIKMPYAVDAKDAPKVERKDNASPLPILPLPKPENTNTDPPVPITPSLEEKRLEIRVPTLTPTPTTPLPIAPLIPTARPRPAPIDPPTRPAPTPLDPSVPNTPMPVVPTMPMGPVGPLLPTTPPLPPLPPLDSGVELPIIPMVPPPSR